MSLDSPATVILCGAFALSDEVRAAVAAAGLDVVADTPGTAAALDDAGAGLRLVAIDADGWSSEHLTQVIRRAARGGSRVLAVGAFANRDDIAAAFRAGAADVLVGPRDTAAVVAHLTRLRHDADIPTPIQVGELRRLIAKLVHDVKNPIGNILGYIDILREDTSTPPDAEQSDLLQRIERNCNIALEVLGRYGDMADRRR